MHLQVLRLSIFTKVSARYLNYISHLIINDDDEDDDDDMTI
jgi:hypothetical protein